MNHVWGLDLGGTKIEGVILPADGSIHPICRTRIATEADRGYDHIVGRIAKLIGLMESESGLKRPPKIGIGTPGAADPVTGLMKNCNTTSLNGKPLPADLTAELKSEIVLANDANCFALAEATLGAAAGVPTVFGVIMGTGVGGGVVVHGKVLNGAQGIAGEWGHNVLERDGLPCYCGKVGCVETVLSGPFLERYYASISGEKRKLVEIAQRAEAGGDPCAEQTMARLYEKFGEAISVVVDILDPHVVVVGGGVGNILGLYTHGRQALRKWVFNDDLRTELRRPTLGDSAGVFGAAMLARD